MQTKKYDGFYVARFEAGLDANIVEFTTKQQHTGSNQIYNQEGTPQSKPGIVPWNFIDWNHSQSNAKKMYDTATIQSGLITGTQWDVMINWMTNKNETELTDSSWGNCATSTNTIALGRTSYTYGASDGSWYQEAFSNNWTVNEVKLPITVDKNSNKGNIWTTGASEDAKKKNLYDVAGNLWEWTEEVSYYGGNSINECRVIRGGCYHHSSVLSPVCYRNNNQINNTDLDRGFRVVLYIK